MAAITQPGKLSTDALAPVHRRIRIEASVLFVALLALFALALRVLRLDFQPLWWDEGYSVWFATHPLGQMIALTAQDIHPPLYYALLHGWIGLLGAGPVALRLFSVAAGVLAIPAIYLAGRSLLTRRAALLVAFLLAISPFHVYYSQEVRMYGLVMLFSIGVLWAAWRVMGRGGEVARWRGGKLASWQIADSKSANQQIANGDLAVGRADVATQAALPPHHLVTSSPGHHVTLSSVAYVLFATAALYTQYYAVFLPIGLTLYACWYWRRDLAALTRWLAIQAVVALLYLPWVFYAAPKLVPYISQKVVQDADRPLDLLTYLARHLAAFLAGHLEGPQAAWWPLVLLLLIPLLIGLWLALKGENREAGSGRRGEREKTYSPTPPLPHSPPLLLAVTLTALVLGWLISLRYPFFPQRGERLLLLALPAFVLLAATTIDALWARARGLGIATAALIGAVSAASLFAFYTVPRYASDDYRPLIARTVEQGLPEDTVFAIYPWQVGYWRSYGSPHGPTAVLTPETEWTPTVAAALDAALARGKVWFPAHLALGAILETRVEQYLGARAMPFINEWYGPGTRLSGWATTAEAGADTPQTAAPEVHFPLRGASGAVTLAGVEAPSDPVPAANAVVPLTLRWRAAEVPSVLDVSVRLVDAIGRIWAQHDYEPLGGMQNADCTQSAQTADCTPGGAPEASVTDGWQAEDRLGLLIPAGTPPGQYTVEIALHPKGDLRPLDAQAPDGQPLGAAARLSGLTVAPADRSLDPERLPIGVRETIDFEDGIRLLGHTLDDHPVAPGETRPVNLFWQATGTPSADYVAFVQLLDGAGGVASGWEAPPGGSYDTSRWQPGTLIRLQASLRPHADLPDGRYRLIAGLFRASDKARLHTAGGADHVELGTVTVRGRSHDLTPPTPQHPADATFEQAGRLVGYDLANGADGVAAGGALPLTLYWLAAAATDRPYTVFVHLMDENGTIRGYGDSEPGGGRFPTTGWLAGEYLADAHEVSVEASAPPGVYHLRIGLYDPASGQRLLTPDGADHIDLASVTIR